MSTKKDIIARAKAAKAAAKQRVIDGKERLISEVEIRPPIWDKFLREHRDKYLADSLWSQIGNIFQLSGLRIIFCRSMNVCTSVLTYFTIYVPSHRSKK